MGQLGKHLATTSGGKHCRQDGQDGGVRGVVDSGVGVPGGGGVEG